jgi:LysM repeat protein
MKRVLLLTFLLYNSLNINAQPSQKDTPAVRLTATDYVNEYADDAVIDMKKTGVPASITLAQGMFESDYGNSPLATEAKNHFGIKCHKEWTGKTYIQDDDAKNECFRKYDNVLQSYDDHSDFLKTRDRYNFLFDLPVTDYKAWAKGLKKAGYATNPEYANRLIKIIEENNLQRFDAMGEATVAELYTNKVNQNTTANEPPIVTTPMKFNIPTMPLCDDIPFAIATKGDTWFKLAKDNNISLGEIFKYNDANANTILRDQMLVYLGSKHNRSATEFYIVKEGDTMWYISQIYGVKLKKLYRYNKVDDKVELQPGQKIKLR